MEETKNESCCHGGKCACHNKWFRLMALILLAGFIFILGVSLGSHLGNRWEGRGSYFDRASNRGYGMARDFKEACPIMNGDFERPMNLNAPALRLSSSTPSASSTLK